MLDSVAEAITLFKAEANQFEPKSWVLTNHFSKEENPVILTVSVAKNEYNVVVKFKKDI